MKQWKITRSPKIDFHCELSRVWKNGNNYLEEYETIKKNVDQHTTAAYGVTILRVMTTHFNIPTILKSY